MQGIKQIDLKIEKGMILYKMNEVSNNILEYQEQKNDISKKIKELENRFSQLLSQDLEIHKFNEISNEILGLEEEKNNISKKIKELENEFSQLFSKDIELTELLKEEIDQKIS